MRRTHGLGFVPLICAGLVFCAGLAGAQAQYRPGYGPPPPGGFVSPRDRPHLYAGAQLGGFGVLAQVTDQAGYMGQGGGGGVHIGYRFGRFSLEFNLGITYHDESLGTVGGTTFIALNSLFLMTSSVDVKVYFGSKRGWIEPFLQAGLGYAYLGANYTDDYCANSFSCDTTFAQGPMYQVGGGIEMWIWRLTSLWVRLLYRGVIFNEANYGDITVRNDNGNFVNGIALDVGASFHF